MPYINYRSPKTEITVAEIFRKNWTEYREQNAVTAQQAKVVGSIMACRTLELGGRIDQCQECGAMVFHFKSCRDRHCNQCQKYERAKWVEKQKVMLLPVPYFHIVFTVDHSLNGIIRQNQWRCYNLIFETVAKSLQRMAKEELGCELGITAVLHTWGQKLDEHYHVHCIVTGGGLALDRRRWVKSKSQKYLFNVKKLSRMYRDGLLDGLKKRHQKGQLPLFGETAQLDVEEVLEQARGKKWEVFAKAFEKAEAVYEYLSRYVHQVAISNYRLRKVEEGRVKFEYYDNKERAEVGGKGKKKELRLPVQEFMRRYLAHILPEGFVRIRYYGLHHPSARKEKLPRCREYLGLERTLPPVKELSLLEWLREILGEEVGQCPHCGAVGTLVEQTRFTHMLWLIGIILSLFGQPTTAGVRG